MTMTNPSKRLTWMAAVVLGLSVLTLAAPATAQDGLLMRNIFGKLGILPEEKDPIEYRERPGLVVPKELDKLRQPENPDARARNSQWPVDPDVVEREQERKRRNASIITPSKLDASEGGRLSVQDMARGRSARGAQIGEPATPPGNEKGAIRMSVQEMTADRYRTSVPTYAAGTEPPRQFLTDPPKGLRVPSSGAAYTRPTTEAPNEDDFRRPNAQRRVD